MLNWNVFKQITSCIVYHNTYSRKKWNLDAKDLNNIAWKARTRIQINYHWELLPQCVVIHTVKDFGIVNKTSGTLLLFWWSSGCWQFDLWFLCLFKIQLEHLEIQGSLLRPGLENFKHYFPSVWDEWVQLYSSLNILWHCLSLRLEWKLNFSSPVATAEFSKFPGILSAALSQHRLIGFEIAQLEFHHLHEICV